MNKTLTALAVATTFAVAAVATPTTADARWWGWRGGAFVGGLAAGALIGSAYARPYYGYGSYYGGYNGHYSNYYYPAASYYNYYAPTPVYYSYYATPHPYYNCWRGRYGYRYRVC
jgi:hypothetical protein